MARIIHGTLYVPVYTPTGNPGEYTITGATYENAADATGNGAYDLNVGFVLFVPCVDPVGFFPVPGEAHRYVITSITYIDQVTIDCTILWNEDAEPTEVDLPQNGAKAIIAEKGACLGLGLTVSNQIYGDLAPGLDVAAIVNDEKNKIECGATGPSGYSGFSGAEGISGYSGQLGTSGYSGFGESGWSGFSGLGESGWSGFSGSPGTSVQEEPVEVVYSSFSGVPPIEAKSGRVDVLSFPATGTTCIDYTWEIPENFQKTYDVQIEVTYHMSTSESGDVVLKLETQYVKDGEDTLVGTLSAQTQTITVPSTSNIVDRYVFTVSTSSLPDPSYNYGLRYTLTRLGDSGSDTHGGSFVAESIVIRFTGTGGGGSPSSPLGPSNTFLSSDITGTGSLQNTAHGFGTVPVLAFATTIAGHDGAGGPGNLVPTIIYGTHDSTNCKFTVTSGATYRVIALK